MQYFLIRYNTKLEILKSLNTKYADKIKDAVLADYIMLGKMAGFTKELDINGEEVTFGVSK